MGVHAMPRVAVWLPMLVVGAATALLLLQLVGLHLASRWSAARRRSSSPTTSPPVSLRPSSAPRARHPFGKPRVSRAMNQALIAECAAFLDGSYVTQTGAVGRGASLAWLNHLAHADRDHLEARAASIWWPTDALLTSWPAAASFLAHVFIGRCSSAADLENLQRAVLVPLELDLLSRPEPPPGPQVLSRLILGRLEQQRRPRP